MREYTKEHAHAGIDTPLPEIEYSDEWGQT